jgi:hypothetical protein
MDDFDITGLDAKAAREYVLAVVTTLRQTSAKRQELERDRALWSGRAKLAAEKGRSDLQAEAEVRLRDVEFQLNDIRAEEDVLTAGVRRLKSQLKVIEATPQLSVDADQLLTELEILGGERDELAEKLKEEEANAALEDLKKRMEDEEGS